MKRYNITVREIWNVTRQVEAENEFDAESSYLDGLEVKRVRVSSDKCEAYNTIEEIQK